MDLAISAAQWVVGKALAWVTDPVLEAYAASKELGVNVDALKMELLYAQAMLDNTQGREIRSPALKELLLKLQQLAYNADDALDELDYFRIQDDLDGTSEAADDVGGRGYIQDNIQHVRHTAKAAPDLLGLALASADGSDRRGIKRKLASSVGHTAVHALGKKFPWSSFPPVQADDAGAGVSDTITPAQQQESVVDGGAGTSEIITPPPKLEFPRVKLSETLKQIVDELKPLCAKVAVILNLELLDSNRAIAKQIAANTGAALLREEGHATILPKSEVKTRVITTSYISETNFVGREDETRKIKNIITSSEDRNLLVLPITGLGGMGKTTLAQHIYDQVGKDFDVKIWVCVSVNFSAARLLKDIENKIPKVDNEDRGAPTEKLIEQRLKSKRFLLVLDDMWDPINNDEWQRLLAPLRKGEKKGNIVLITSRSPALAQMVSEPGNNTVELEGLGKEAFWELFKSYVFDDEESKSKKPALIDIGKEIVKKLKGSPLAAKTVGKLLRNHLDQNHWQRVLDSKEWELQTGDDDIMPALKLSFDFLPFHLQRCFSYCCLFPEDHKFVSTDLIHWWIGLDIVQSSGHQNKSIEEIGSSNLDELVAHGFINKKYDEMDGSTYYVIHDLLHDLGLKVAARECLSINSSNVASVEIWPSVRHLSITIDDANDYGQIAEDFRDELKRLIKSKRLKIENLQTLMIFGKIDDSFTKFFGDNLISKANGLRVLLLSEMGSRLEFPTLTHLRYLSLGSTRGREIHLPSMLSRFYHLRILDLQYYYWGSSLGLPGDMSNLTKLAHFLTDDDKKGHSRICNVGKLQFLQDLRRFEVNKESNGFELRQLENLIELRELGIYHLEKVHTKEEAAKAKLTNKTRLLKLTLDWDCEHPENERDAKGEVLEGLQPHRNLQELWISGHGSLSCPTWLGSNLSIKGLQSLYLVGVGWEKLPWLGYMVMLRELELWNMSTLQEFGPSHFGSITSQSFGNLERLTLVGLRGLNKWALGDNCDLLCQLKVLIIKDCRDLLALPFTENNNIFPPRQDQDGKTRWFPKLQKLEIDDCPRVASLPPIPWTQTLCTVNINGVKSSKLKSLRYSKTPGSVELEILGKEESSGEEKVLVFTNLTDLQELDVWRYSQFKNLQLLTSLKVLCLTESDFVLPESSEGEVQWHIPVERLRIVNCHVTGKELAQLLSHLPKLSELRVSKCENIRQMGVEIGQQQPTAHVASPSASSVVKSEKGDYGLLLLPAHLSDSLRKLEILECSQLCLCLPYPSLPDDYSKSGGGLHALRSLQELFIDGYGCPRLFDAYKTTSFPSARYLFPPSLKKLTLWLAAGMGTLERISNLTSLTELHLFRCLDEDFRWDGLLPLVTRGNLSKLGVRSCRQFFIGPDLVRELQDEAANYSCKLKEVETNEVATFLTARICTILSSSLTSLTLVGWDCVEQTEHFTTEQEDALQLLTCLEDLNFWYLRKLQRLPAGLHKLPKLKRCSIDGCPLISSLPEGGLPDSLQELHVRFCANEELKQQCRNFILDHPRIKLHFI